LNSQAILPTDPTLGNVGSATTFMFRATTLSIDMSDEVVAVSSDGNKRIMEQTKKKCVVAGLKFALDRSGQQLPNKQKAEVIFAPFQSETVGVPRRTISRPDDSSGFLYEMLANADTRESQPPGWMHALSTRPSSSWERSGRLG